MGTQPADRARALAWSGTEVLPAEQVSVPLLDEGFLRGDAVFEAMLVRRGRTHDRSAHLARLERSARALDMDVPDFGDILQALLERWGPQDGVLRMIVTRNGTVRAIVGTLSWPKTISLCTIDIPWRTALSGVKTLSYAANQWAIRRAQAGGADDASSSWMERFTSYPQAQSCS